MVKTITVLLAAYQGEKHLPAQLDSLAAQDDASFRVLMQDDGSSDGTTAILKQMARDDARFALAGEQGGHRGAKGNFWSLLAQDDQPYSAFCDQDDIWLPKRLSACRAAMEAAERRYGAEAPILVHSDCCVTDEDRRTLQESFFAHQGWDAQAVSLAQLLVQNNVTGCTVMINAPLRRLAVQYGNPDDLFMHDWFLALTAAAFGHIVFVPQALVQYRQHGQNVLGASKAGLIARGMKALGAVSRGRERIALTYRHARMFRKAYGGALPKAAGEIVDAYIATEKMGRLRRIIAVQRGGYRMQSAVTRLGQIFFG